MQKADEKLSTIEDPLLESINFYRDLHDYCEKNPDAAKLIIIEPTASPEVLQKYQFLAS